MIKTLGGYPYFTKYTQSFSTAKDLLRITIPANPADAYLPRKRTLLLSRVVVGTSVTETTEKAVISLHRATTAGTGGDALVFGAEVGAPAFIAGLGGSGAGNLTGDTTKGAEYASWSADLGLENWVWDRADHPLLRWYPGQFFVVRLDTALSGATALHISVEFDMVP